MSTGYWLGVDLGGTKILAGLFDDDLKLLARSKQPTAPDTGPAGVFANVVKAVDAVVRESGVDPLVELTLYVVHGILHLRGYDDLTPDGVAAFRSREGEIFEDLGLINPFSRVGPAEIGRGQLSDGRGREHRLALRIGGVGRSRGEQVGPGREKGGGEGQRKPFVPGSQHEHEREIATGRVTGDDGRSVGAEAAPDRDDILDGRRERMLRREPVIGNEDRKALARKKAGHGPMGLWRTRDEAAAVKV